MEGHVRPSVRPYVISPKLLNKVRLNLETKVHTNSCWVNLIMIQHLLFENFFPYVEYVKLYKETF
jgi:hypothetical protein